MPNKPTYEELEQKVLLLEKQLQIFSKSQQDYIYSKPEFRELSKIVFEAIFISENGLCVDQNPLAETMFGYTRDEAIGRPGTDWIYESDRDFVKEKMQCDYSGPYEVTALHKDGSTFLCEIQSRNTTFKGKILRLTALRDITDRKNAVKALSDREAYMQSVFRVAPTGIGVVKNRVFSDVNDRFCNMLGYSREEFIGKPSRIVYPSDGEYSKVGKLKYEEINRTGSGTVETLMKCKDGNLINVLLSSTPIDPNDHNVGITFTALDITKRKNAEQGLRHSEERLQLALDSVTDAIWDWHIDNKTVYFSPRWYTMLEYEPDELAAVFETWLDLLHPDDRNKTEATIKQHLELTESFEMEFRMKTKGGQWKWILARGKTVEKDDNGRAIRMLGTHIDINARKMASKQLLEQKRVAERYLNLAGVIFVGLDIDGSVTLTNQKAVDVLGYRMDEIVGKNWVDTFIKPSDSADIREVFNKLLNGEVEPIEYYENNVITKEGLRKVIAWHNTYITDETGKISSILSAGSDITEQRTLEGQLLKLQKMESIGNLAAGIAHDFNNLLFPIIGMAEMLLEDIPPNSTEYENVLEILKAGQRGGELVKQILTFSRQSKQERTPTKIQDIVEEALKLTRATIPSNIIISSNIQSECPTVLADPTQIHQVIINLITNAYHSIENANGEIEVSLNVNYIEHPDYQGNMLESGRYATLIVADNGCGISSDMLDKIFEPYFTTKDKGKGTGLGLAVVYGIIKEHGGVIRVESRRDKGSEFIVYLPLVEDYSHSEIGEEEKKQIKKGSEKILVVDDEPSIAKLEKRMLERSGYLVTTCLNSLEALQMFKENPEKFDLVVTDMTMPNLTGDQLAKEMLAVAPDTAIILCTGFSEIVDDVKAKEMGLQGFLSKPVSKDEMTRTVREILDRTHTL